MSLFIALTTTYECICIQEDTLAILGQCPAADLGEGGAELRTSQQGQAEWVSAVHHAHCDDLIEHIVQGNPDWIERLKQSQKRNSETNKPPRVRNHPP